MAIDVNGAFGGTTDPFGRKIGWTTVANKPDLVIYDVVDAYNFEALYQWQGASWANIGSTINPGYGGGSNGLGIVENTGFVEFRLPLTVLGSPAPGTPIRLEWWMTQDGASKGPLDAVFSDGVQMSRATGTTFDTTAVVEMLGYKTYTILNAVDNTPPTVTAATATGFALLGNKQFALTTNKIDVTFSEPVDADHVAEHRQLRADQHRRGHGHVERCATRPSTAWSTSRCRGTSPPRRRRSSSPRPASRTCRTTRSWPTARRTRRASTSRT